MLNKRYYLFMVLFIVFVSTVFAQQYEHTAQYIKSEHPLKILFVVGVFPHLPETTILNQITGLLDRGHEVFIYSFHPGQKKMHADVMKYKLLKRTYYKEPPPDLESYDVILCQFGPLGKRLAKIKKERHCNAKLITFFRGYDLTKEGKRKGPHVYDKLFKEGDLFLPVCEYFKDELIKLGCDPQKIMVQHSAIDMSRFTFRSGHSKKTDSVRIISVNRLVPKKGMEYAIQAVGQLMRKYPKLRYLIVGDGYRKRFLTRLIRKVRAQGKINLLGWATQDRVISLLNSADIFILPSVTATDGNEEGIPNALKEAMARGLPVVSTYHAGIPELVENNESGFLVPQRDVKQLAQKIEYLLLNPEVRKQMGIVGREKVQQEYDVEVLNDRLVEILYQVLQKDQHENL